MTNPRKYWFWKTILFLFCLVFFYQVWILCHIVYWNSYNPSTSAFMQHRLDILRNKNPSNRIELRYKWIPYELISPYLKRAVIASEDAKFLKHNGFDYIAIQMAYKKNLEKKKFIVGGSTISQQLAKNLFLSTKKTPWRKMEEAIITLMLENVMSKRRILEIYLNIIEWGNNVFGAEAAAQYYYNISSFSLSAKQSALLAAMIPNPRFYDQNRNTTQLLKKSDIILKRMGSSRIP
ncbi:MAG: monofunctional biosynthetic peptidoglycan transglycosylase [Nitrosomonadales bacterium]|nr:MAG: monofunctional biosynthetic peptidoglycan transglycosylase [Nitrosomonadales bacterium]